MDEEEVGETAARDERRIQEPTNAQLSRTRTFQGSIHTDAILTCNETHLIPSQHLDDAESYPCCGGNGKSCFVQLSTSTYCLIPLIVVATEPGGRPRSSRSVFHIHA